MKIKLRVGKQVRRGTKK
jgi:hypothetical protein